MRGTETVGGFERQHWTFHVLGCRGSWPVCGKKHLEFGGATSCYLIKDGDYALILDCGTGLYNAGALLRGCNVAVNRSTFF